MYKKIPLVETHYKYVYALLLITLPRNSCLCSPADALLLLLCGCYCCYQLTRPERFFTIFSPPRSSQSCTTEKIKKNGHLPTQFTTWSRVLRVLYLFRCLMGKSSPVTTRFAFAGTWDNIHWMGVFLWWRDFLKNVTRQFSLSNFQSRPWRLDFDSGTPDREYEDRHAAPDWQGEGQSERGWPSTNPQIFPRPPGPISEAETSMEGTSRSHRVCQRTGLQQHGKPPLFWGRRPGKYIVIVVIHFCLWFCSSLEFSCWL